jgi:hypothetical protein
MALRYKIMVQCPVSGKRIDSGIRTTGREALSSGLFQDGSVACPHCGQMHTFESNCFLDVEQTLASNRPWRPNRQA